MHKSKVVIEDAQEIIAKWLKERGLELSIEKTKIVHSTEGFDFLGFNCRHYDNPENGFYAKNNQNRQGFKLLIKPSQKSINKHSDKVSEVLKRMKVASQEDVIDKLNPIIRGWTNYFRGVVASGTFKMLDNLMWNKLWTWAKRRHSIKGRRWIADRYFHTIGKRKWRFATLKDGEISATLALYSETKIRRHVKVKSGKSFYDGDEVYWGSRLSRGYGDISPSKARMLKKQDGKCAECDKMFKNGDLMESHHKQYKSKGGDSFYSNLVLMHKHCHDQFHANHRRAMVASGRFPGEIATPVYLD